MQLFSGSSNQRLTQKVAQLGLWDQGEVVSTEFENGERKIGVGKGSGGAAVVQSFSQPVDAHLIEFCLLCDALSRAGYTEIIGVIPWLGYSKQDKVFLPGEPLSAQVVAQILQTTKIKKLITFDLHKSEIIRFFDIPVVELSARPLFFEYLRHKITDKTVVVAPDAGAVKASTAYASELNVPMASIDKRRDLKTGKVEVISLSGSVKGREVIMIDDMIVTGSTLMETVKALKQAGAISVSFAATHHLWVPGVQEKLEQSAVDEIVVTDTVQSTNARMHERTSQKLQILSVAQLIVDELS